MNDLSDLVGVRKMLKSPEAPPKSPLNDLLDVHGLKKLMKTPKVDSGPKNDLSNIASVKRILKTPKTPYNSPVANYDDLKGVKKHLKPPGQPQKGPANVLEDLAGVTDLVSTPEPIIVARAAVTVDKTPNEPSTSRAQTPKAPNVPPPGTEADISETDIKHNSLVESPLQHKI